VARRQGIEGPLAGEIGAIMTVEAILLDHGPGFLLAVGVGPHQHCTARDGGDAERT